MCARRSALLALILAIAGATMFCGAPASADPNLRVRKSGRIVVRWDQGCVVRYDAQGRHRSTERACSAGQRCRADDRVRRHPRTAGSGNDGGGGIADPRFARRGDRAEASKPNGCRIDHDRDGRRRDANRACSSAQLQKAERRAKRFLAQSGGGGGLEYVERSGRTEAD